MIKTTWRLMLISVCLIVLTGLAQPIGLAATPAIDPQACAPLPPPSGTIVNVSTVSQLKNAVNSAVAGTTSGLPTARTTSTACICGLISQRHLALGQRHREAVMLDGNYQTTEIIQVVASNVTIADLTLREAYYHPIHVISGEDADTLNTLIYNVHIIDPGEQAIKINPAARRLFHRQRRHCLFPHRVDRAGGRTSATTATPAASTRINPQLDHPRQSDRRLLVQQRSSEHGIHLWRSCREPSWSATSCGTMRAASALG